MSDALAMLEASLTWARPTGYAPPMSWHRVASLGGGSIATACSGRWSLLDPYETSADPAKDERCEACSNDSIAAAAGPEKPVSCDSGSLTTETTSLVSGQPAPFKSRTGAETVGGDRLSCGLAELRHAPVIRTLRASDEFEMFDVSDVGGEG